MNNAEDKIWEYWDGTASEADRQFIEKQMESDPLFKNRFNEIRAIHFGLSDIEGEEPSMSFQRNVMEKVRLEAIPGSFKSVVDKRIIYGIGLFFLLSITLLLGYAFYSLNWTEILAEPITSASFPKISPDPELTKNLIRILILADLVAGLYFLDALLRRKINSKKI